MDSSNWNVEAGNLAAFLGLGVGIPAVFLVLAFVQPTKRQMERWAAVCSVTLTDTNRDQVRSHLSRVRRFRSLVAFPFWCVWWIPFVNTGFPPGHATPLPAIAAYLAGALFAEATGGGARTPATAERRAALMTRTMEDYAPRWIRTLPYLLVTTGALAVVLARVFHGPHVPTEAAVTVALSAIFSTCALLVGSAIVRRPQRGSEPDVLAADDALRSTGVSTALAAGSLGGLLAATTGGGALIPATSNAWWLLLLIPGVLVIQGLAIGLLMLVIRQETLGYRRRYRQARTTTRTVLA